MTPSDCTLVIVTKGARDIRRVIDAVDAVGFGQLIIWDNLFSSREYHCPDWKVYGRYVGMEGAWQGQKAICTQDDDTLIDWPALIACYQPGKLVCNMPAKWRPHYETTGGICLVGFGSIFDRALLEDAFGPYDRAGFERDEVFLRECDRVFTFLNRHRTVWADVPITQLPCSFDADRMWKESRHEADYQEIRRRLALIK